MWDLIVSVPDHCLCFYFSCDEAHIWTTAMIDTSRQHFRPRSECRPRLDCSYTGCHSIHVLEALLYDKTPFVPPHDKTNKMACAPSEDSDQPGHLPSLIWVFGVHMKKPWTFSYPLNAQQSLWSDWADARLTWVFAVLTVFLFVLSWGVSLTLW